MSVKTVAIAEFAIPPEAHLALELLRQHSIQGFISDDTTNPLNFSLFGRMPYSHGIQLYVPETQADEARKLLGTQKREKPPKGWEEEAERGKGWLCHLCDTYTEEDVAVCPACGEQRQASPNEER
jgi:hypothetical protein